MILGRKKGADKESAREKERMKRERDKRKKMSRKYGQAEIKHSKRGISSCFFAVCTVFVMFLLFSASYISKGEINLLFGFVGLSAAVMSCMGVICAVQGFREREKNYLSCKIGLGCNALLLLGLISIFLRGFY